MAIDRTNYNALVDDSGLGTDGSLWDKTKIKDVLLDPIDAALANMGAATLLTLASDAVTVTGHHHRIDTEAAAASDNLATLTAGTGVTDGHLLVLKPENVAHVVTVKDGTGNILLKGGDFAMNDAKHRLLVIKDGSSWYEIARSAVAAGGGGSPLSLLKANSGTTTNASAENVDTVAISGLTAKDVLFVMITLDPVTQNVASPALYNSTDSVTINSIVINPLVAGNRQIWQGYVSQFQAGPTSIASLGVSADGIRTGTPTFTTNWTGSWTLALRHGGVTSGGTFKWSWSVYKWAGQ